MEWKKLKPSHYFTKPVEHIYTSSIFDIKEYDKLYENQNNLSHQLWENFDTEFKIGFEFLQDIRDLNLNKQVICLWFFKDRGDRDAGKDDIELADKVIKYAPNTFLITDSKQIKIKERKKLNYNRPALQLDLNKSIWNKICHVQLQRIKKN